jgi:hypothetical protein
MASSACSRLTANGTSRSVPTSRRSRHQCSKYRSRDLVVAMLTISDNAATDTLLSRVSLDSVNASSARLGLRDTVINADVYTTIDSIGQDAGFARRQRVTWRRCCA